MNIYMNMVIGSGRSGFRLVDFERMEIIMNGEISLTLSKLGFRFNVNSRYMKYHCGEKTRSSYLHKPSLQSLIRLRPFTNLATVSQADGIFKRLFMNGKFCILIWISLKFVFKCPVDNKTALVQVMAWRQRGYRPLPEPMLTQFTNAYSRH